MESIESLLNKLEILGYYYNLSCVSLTRDLSHEMEAASLRNPELVFRASGSHIRYVVEEVLKKIEEAAGG